MGLKNKECLVEGVGAKEKKTEHIEFQFPCPRPTAQLNQLKSQVNWDL